MAQHGHGYALTGASAPAAEAFQQAVRGFALVYGDAMGLLETALAEAPGMVMAHLAKGWLLTLPNDPALAAQARPLVDAAGRMAMNEAEAAHLAALRLALAGERQAAVTVLERHLMDYPFDVLAHTAATFIDIFRGRIDATATRLSRALPLWPKDAPGYGIVLGLYGFGLEEAGAYAEAEEHSRASAELEPHGFFAHHAVSHVMEMTGRPEDGLGWMAARAPYWAAPQNGLRAHIWWHQSLFHVELGQFDAALSVYDDQILQTMRPVGTRLCDPAALLWRLDLLGHDTGRRWHELLPLLDGHSDGRCLMFTDMHGAMAELRTGHEARVERRLGWMRATASGDGEAAWIYRSTGIPLIEGLLAFHRGRYAEAVDLLFGLRDTLWQIGGSKAQRDIVQLTLLAAALRGGLRGVAQALSQERLAARPRSAVNRQFQRAADLLAA